MEEGLQRRLGNERGEREFGAALASFLEGGEARLLADAGLERRADSHGGEGLFATRSLPQGFTLRLPRAFALDAALACRTKLGSALRGAPRPRSATGAQQQPFTAEEVFLAVLADARPAEDHRAHLPSHHPAHSLGPAATSLLAPYAARLPQVSPDAASWAASARRLLAGTDLGKALMGAEPELPALVGRLQQVAAGAHISLESLRWARGMSLSRRFPAWVGSDSAGEDDAAEGVWGTLGTLLPVADALNHRVGSGTTRISIEGCEVLVGNSSPLRVGDEATISYGDTKSNEELLGEPAFPVICTHPSL